MLQKEIKAIGKAGQARGRSLAPQGTQECELHWRQVSLTLRLPHPISHLLDTREVGRIKAILRTILLTRASGTGYWKQKQTAVKRGVGRTGKKSERTYDEQE